MFLEWFIPKKFYALSLQATRLRKQPSTPTWTTCIAESKSRYSSTTCSTEHEHRHICPSSYTISGTATAFVVAATTVTSKSSVICSTGGWWKPDWGCTYHYESIATPGLHTTPMPMTSVHHEA